MMEPTKEELIDCIKNFLGILDTPLGRQRFPGSFASECIQIGRDLLARSSNQLNQDLEFEQSLEASSVIGHPNTEFRFSDLKIFELAKLIAEDWPHPNYAAAPYLEAMHSLTNISDTYYADSGKSIIVYFLANAQTWKGETAKVIKAELKKRCNLK